jgi:hypothetical protein
MIDVSRVPPSYKTSFASAQYAEINKKTKTEMTLGTPKTPQGGEPIWTALSGPALILLARAKFI